MWKIKKREVNIEPQLPKVSVSGKYNCLCVFVCLWMCASVYSYMYVYASTSVCSWEPEEKFRHHYSGAIPIYFLRQKYWSFTGVDLT